MANNLLACLLFGLTLAAAVGPIALLIINTGLTTGVGAAMAAGLGAATADLIYALLAFTLGSLLLPTLSLYEHELQFGSAWMLIALGIWMIWRAVHAGQNPLPAARSAPASGPFLSTLLLTLVNPLTIVLFASFAAQRLDSNIGLGLAAGMAVALFLGSLLVQWTFAIGGAALATVIKGHGARLCLNGLSGLGIALFGVYWHLNSAY